MRPKLQTSIVQCLNWFGACSVPNIARKLNDRGELHTEREVNKALEQLVDKDEVELAEGFKGKILFKIKGR